MLPRLNLIVLICLAASIVLPGCGTPAATSPDADRDHMKVVGLLYGMYQSQHGEPPSSQERFEAFLQQSPANWEKLASTPKELLSSPRNGKPLQIIYGKSAASSGDPWVAYEAEAIDGGRLIVNDRGSVRLVDEEQFHQLVPPQK
jgi:hypothetical protein